MNKNKYLYLLVFILLILWLFTCNPSAIIDAFKKPTIDTVITHKSDTVWAKDTLILFKYKVVNKPYAVTVDLNPLDSNACDSIRQYKQSFEDTNLTVFTEDSVKGRLLGQNISYKLKIPIKIIDSVFINITKTTEIPPKVQLFIGGEAQIWPLQPHLGPVVTLKDKKQRLYHYHYDIFSNSHSVGYSILIKNPLKRKTN